MMTKGKIFVTGQSDTHGEFDRFTSKNFPEGKTLTKEDYVIILGDFGGVWDGSPEENYWLDWLEEKPWTTLFISGNHEAFPLLYTYPVKEFAGGMVNEIRPSILHLRRGEAFNLCGKTFFAMGGAASHDISDGILYPDDPNYKEMERYYRKSRKSYRICGVDWWPEELPSNEELAHGWDTIEKLNYEVDYILSHCAPTYIREKLFGEYKGYCFATDYAHKENMLTDFLTRVEITTNFTHHYFGHYHFNEQITPRHTVLYKDIERIV